jgi:hypothetical protein
MKFLSWDLRLFPACIGRQAAQQARTSPPQFLHRRATGLLLCCFSLLPLLYAQRVQSNEPLSKREAPVHDNPKSSTEILFAEAPFAEWLLENHQQRTTLPVKLWISGGVLEMNQRLSIHIQARVPGDELRRRAEHPRIIALLQMTNVAGEQFRDYGLMTPPTMKLNDAVAATFDWTALVTPGDYEIVLAVYDPAQGDHTLVGKKLHIPPLKDDPLPHAWDGLPGVALGPAKAGVARRLNLPVATARPVCLDVVLDVTASEVFHGNQLYYNLYLARATVLLAIFTQIELPHGTINAVAVDLKQQKVTWEKNNIKETDWVDFESILKSIDPNKINVGAFRNRSNPVFLRDEVIRLVAHKPAAPEPDGGYLHVIVVIGSPLGLYKFPALAPISGVRQSDLLIYFLQDNVSTLVMDDILQYQTGKRPSMDQKNPLGKFQEMMSPLEVKVFQMNSDMDTRRAMATILQEIHKKDQLLDHAK